MTKADVWTPVLRPRSVLRRDDVLLQGVLSVWRVDPANPALVATFWCPHCREGHPMEWPDSSGRSDGVLEITAPCLRGPLAGRAIFVGLDPEQAEANWNTARRHARGLGHAQRAV